MVISCVATGFLSLLADRLLYQPLVKRNSSLNVILITSIGIMVVMTNVLAMIFGNEPSTITDQISEGIWMGPIILTKVQILQFLVCSLVIAAFLIFLKFSRFGLSIRALRDDATLLIVLGQNTEKMRLRLFFLSGILVAIAGNLVVRNVGIEPYDGLPMFLNAVVAMIVGGMGSFGACVLGGLFLGVLQSFVVWALSPRWVNGIGFLILVIFLLLRPRGFFGETLRRT
jgi:branched-chain amino acid transport system permease protein